MRIVFSILISSVSLSASAASLTSPRCLELAKLAAFKTARPAGNRPNSSLVASIGRSELVAQKDASLLYQVEIDFDVLDGASSDEFPAETYGVQAEGSPQNCQIISIIRLPKKDVGEIL